MVRPHSGSPRSRQRSFSDSSHSEHHGGRLGPSSRGFRGPSGKAPPSWREGSSRGHSPYPRDKRPLMGEPRARSHGHWTPQNQDNFRPYPMSQDSQRGRRRSSPSRSNRPPTVQHRHSPHGPSGHHRPFQSNHSSHVYPSSRYFHSPPSDRRGPSPHNSFRAPQRYQNSPHEQERSWGSGRQPSPRERTLGRPAHEGHRWNGPGGYPHPNGEPRPSDFPQRKPRVFHERNPYPERWSTEREPRKQYGDAGRGRGRGRGRPWHHASEWPRREGGNLYPRPPYRSPSWKSGQPSSSNSSSRFPPRLQERPPMRPMKRRIQELGRPPLHELEHGPPKRFRKEMPGRPMPLKGFGGRGLSLKEKSRLLKGHKFRAESITQFKMPPPRPRPSDKLQRNKMQEAEHVGKSSRLPLRKLALKKSVKRQPSRESPTGTNSKSADPEMDSETQVESRRSVRARSSSPLDRQLAHDMVVVSHWEAGTRSSSPKSSTSWKSRMSHHKTGGNLNHRFGSSARDQKQRRPMDAPGKPLRKPGPFQGPDGVFRRPLMATVLTRPPLHQKPVFRKSQSIMTKYRNMQTLRHKAPPHPRQATSYRRW
ncbi:serine/arginine repetitive matrix protein 1 isoform X2 [Neoarius graeffei]|uniref:serine/arginine repetitive matrix protein 1 isoform X2 n=1 Tax=Neoarius graeffei TaxID=443677 RepID=UPI00298D02D3|nr:serine/arginine repetitive matrix protein 1 isoform X2 [Neoarius graeffei]